MRRYGATGVRNGLPLMEVIKKGSWVKHTDHLAAVRAAKIEVLEKVEERVTSIERKTTRLVQLVDPWEETRKIIAQVRKEVEGD